MAYHRYRNCDGFVFVNFVERTNHKRCLTMGLLTGKDTGDYIIIDWAYTAKYVHSFVVFGFSFWHLSLLWIRDTVHKLIIHSKFVHLHMTRYGKYRCRWHLRQWRHNGLDGVSNHQPHHCLFNRLFRSRSKKTSKLRVMTSRHDKPHYISHEPWHLNNICKSSTFI